MIKIVFVTVVIILCCMLFVFAIGFGHLFGEWAWHTFDILKDDFLEYRNQNENRDTNNDDWD